MKIAVRLEGGLGDFMLGNRFIPAIKELYPKSEVTAFCDTNGSTFQPEMLAACFPQYYKDIIVIPCKKGKECFIESKFGKENYVAHLRNIPDEFTNKMFEEHDKFYDLQVDSLAFMSYDFDWLKYHRFFPTPNLAGDFEKPFNRYIVMNLYTNLSNSHRMDVNYVQALLNSVAQGMPVVCIVTDETLPLYKELIQEGDRCKFFSGNMSQIAHLIKNSSGFIGVDSGFKYFAYAYSKPVLTYTMYATEPHKVMFSHKLRWLPFENDCVPPNCDLQYCLNYFAKLINSRVFLLKPDIQNFESELVDRFNYGIVRI